MRCKTDKGGGGGCRAHERTCPMQSRECIRAGVSARGRRQHKRLYVQTQPLQLGHVCVTSLRSSSTHGIKQQPRSQLQNEKREEKTTRSFMNSHAMAAISMDSSSITTAWQLRKRFLRKDLNMDYWCQNLCFQVSENDRRMSMHLNIETWTLTGVTASLRHVTWSRRGPDVWIPQMEYEVFKTWRQSNTSVMFLKLLPMCMFLNYS